ncbi:hypothetical protein ACIA5D_18325 [Actinoplanes sp. NPDC051513]|uniref:hypothetical protein n=1 Tax=Actinoplanes sp. NPDC051513 TaxID=3363908 RepID=UPI0037BB8DD7
MADGLQYRAIDKVLRDLRVYIENHRPDLIPQLSQFGPEHRDLIDERRHPLRLEFRRMNLAIALSGFGHYVDDRGGDDQVSEAVEISVGKLRPGYRARRQAR